MTAHPIITGILLAGAVALAFLCSLGVLVMRDALQRLHFSAAVVSISAGLIAIAVWIEDADAQARIKVVLIAGVLFLMNTVLTQATARAVHIHRTGHWPPRPEDNIPVIGRDQYAGEEPHSEGESS